MPAGARPVRAGRVRLPPGADRAAGQPRPGADQRPGGADRQAGEQARRRPTPLPIPEPLESLAAEALDAVRNALDALAKSDAAAARAVIAGDRQIDQLRGGPSATDLTESIRREPERVEDWLRLLDIARHLERVGDHAASIAEAVVYLNDGQIIRHAETAREGDPAESHASGLDGSELVGLRVQRPTWYAIRTR